jgi:hypothetical protein
MNSAANPLPGMNPWLEAHWGDIHTSLTTYARDHIQKQLPPDLHARVEEYLSVDGPDDDSHQPRRIAPDVHIAEQRGAAKSAAGTVAVEEWTADEPLRVRRRGPPQTLRYIQIVDLKANRRVVTAIEFISMANKATVAGRRQYLAKQSELLDAEVNLVEIDLLREGSWVLAAQQEIYPQRLKGPYRICVIRAESSEEAEVYQATFSNPLPNIRIPLRTTDKDVLLPLQTIVNQAYENGRYGSQLDYAIMPEPALDPEQFEWITQHLQKHNNAL